MKAIIVNGKVISICEKPLFVKKHDTLDCYIKCSESEAIGVSAGVGEDAGVFNLVGMNEIPDAPVAIIRDDNNNEYLFETHSQAEKSAADIVVMESTLCDNDVYTDERLAAIEEVLCDLDQG